MVKGLSKRVVTVRFPESNVFEQAIFMVREDIPKAAAQIDIVAEACRIAGKYAKQPLSNSSRRNKRPFWPPAVFIAVGAMLTGIAWVICSMLNVFV